MNYYELLGVDPSASNEEIKRSFRREIARYHPDKVHHLGSEFQALAATRAADLTRAYSTLMDAQQRTEYNRLLEAMRRQESEAAQTDPTPPDAATSVEPAAATPRPVPPRPADRLVPDEFLRKVVLNRLRDAVSIEMGAVDERLAKGFDVGYVPRGRRMLFRSAIPALAVLGKFVVSVDPQAVEEIWPLAARYAAETSTPVCVFLLGTALAPAGVIGGEITRQRRRRGGTANVALLPVDVRDWTALVPADAPAVGKAIARNLRALETKQ
ncbi:MAG: J domain-containing protein [Acidobacteria bacterium]|nr:J domain-containing protein [Acidobacteriota bacterium]